MIDPAFPAVDGIIYLHDVSITEFGGASGLRDRGALEASVARVHQIIAYAEEKHVTIFDLATAICASIIRNHPFVDGNKRAGFIALFATLDMNGLYLDASDRDAERMTLALAAGDIDEEAFRDWVAGHSYQV